MDKPNAIDRLAGWVSPTWAANRSAARAWKEYYTGVGRSLERQSFRASHNGGVPTRVDDGTVPSSKGFNVREPIRNGHRNLRERARHLADSNVLASSMLGASASFVIGAGTRIVPTTDDPEFNSRAADMWEDWWDGRTGGSPDVRGMCDGPELERLLWMARLRDGDCGVILLDDGRVQAIQGDLIQTPHERSSDRSVVDGVALNSVNRPTGFWIEDGSEPFRKRWKLIPADDFVYLPRLKRINQVRGETVFAQSFTLFEQIDGYVEAVVMAARMAAMFGLIIKEGPQRWAGLPQTPDSKGTSRPVFDMEPAMVKRLGPDESIEQIQPMQPTTQFEQFMVSIGRLSGLEMALPLEVAMLDFSRTTYSSARAAMIVAQRAGKAEHRAWSGRFISRIYRWRMSKWIKASEIVAPKDGGAEWRHRAIQQPYDYLDPRSEVQAILAEIDGGLRTLTETHQEYYGNFDEFVRVRGDELKKLREAGIAPSKSSVTREENAGLAVDGNESADKFKTETDAYGVAVRAGAVTPQTADEDHFRDIIGLPAMSGEARELWTKQKGVRSPITLTQEDKPTQTIEQGDEPDEQ